MATPLQVKNYLAYWFQLGKQVVTDDGTTHYKPDTVIQGERFSPEFENCWANILETSGQGCHLEGTDQTIDDLLSPKWDVVSCARCDMLVPMPDLALTPVLCPCNDLPEWPNEELPKPRLPVNTHQHLGAMRARLASQSSDD
ncbi:MAG: hypothetical protein AAF635_13575 [Cyanobacteria bacterium P01_C01_bin.69]